MKQRTLGRTGITVGEIGFGTEHVVSNSQRTVDAIIASAVDGGITYFDFFMPERDSRDKMGHAWKGLREKVVIAGHLGVSLQDGQYTRSRDPEVCRKDFHDLLRRLGTDYVDVMMLHYVDEPEDAQRVLTGEFMELAQQLKKAGKARCLGMSSHNPRVSRSAADTGLIDVIMFSINPAFDAAGHISSSKTEEEVKSIQQDIRERRRLDDAADRRTLYQHCEDEGVALVAMKPFAGGWLTNPEMFSPPPTSLQCLSYTLAQPGVAAAVPGISTMEELEDVLTWDTASASEKDFSTIIKSNSWDLSGVCMYCNHCLPCPEGINIGEVNRHLDLAKHGNPAELERSYRKLGTGASSCTGCGVCMQRCPFGVDVIWKMEQTLRTYGF